MGRADELAALLDAHAARPDGGLAVIEAAGIGKTRLAGELADPGRSGGPSCSARCHDDEAGLPYGPVVEPRPGCRGRGVR